MHRQIENNRVAWIAAVFILALAALVTAYAAVGYYGDLLVNFTAWMGILALMIGCKKYFNTYTAFTRYFNSASYPIYILHQSILVALVSYVVKFTDNMLLQIVVIMTGSFMLTVMCYELIRRIPVVRGMIGIDGRKTGGTVRAVIRPEAVQVPDRAVREREDTRV